MTGAQAHPNIIGECGTRYSPEAVRGGGSSISRRKHFRKQLAERGEARETHSRSYCGEGVYDTQ